MNEILFCFLNNDSYQIQNTNKLKNYAYSYKSLTRKKNVLT